jgi:hypothetical protein
MGVTIGCAAGERLTCWLRVDVIHEHAEVCRIGTSRVGRLNCRSIKGMGPRRRRLHMSRRW